MKKKAVLFSAGDYCDSTSYPKPKLDLPGVKYDILAIEKRLRQIGFEVEKKENAPKAEYISTLHQSAANGPADAIHVVYFTGHGGHCNGENYIYPSDFTALYDSSVDLDVSSINIKDIISEFKGKGRLILILDACRVDFGSVKGYFSEMAAAENVYIAYGTMFQEESFGMRDTLSWFTEAICDEILAPNIDVDTLFTRVRQNIYTKYAIQIPSSTNALLDKVELHSLPDYDVGDQALYDFIEKHGDSYNEKYGYFQGEYLVFIDASQYFGVSLLEAYWKYTKVQTKLARDKGIKMPLLSEAEQKLISFNIAKNSGYFTFDDIHTWYYNGRQIRMGEIPPSPASMQILPPESGKELDVAIDAHAVITDKQYVICQGTTSLPESTILMIILHSNDQSYRAQSKTKVEAGGKFESETFSYKKESMPSGEYTFEITVPIASVQPENVKIKLGSKGRNLSGRHVKKDSIFGKTIQFEGHITV